MPKPKIEVAGFVTSDAYLSVHFTIRWGTAVRYLEAKVLLSDLAKDVQFNHAYERVQVRLFKQHWEVDTPLLNLHAVPDNGEPPWHGCADDCESCGSSKHDA